MVKPMVVIVSAAALLLGASSSAAAPGPSWVDLGGGSNCFIEAYMPQSFSYNEMTAYGDVTCNLQYNWTLCLQRDPPITGWYDFTCWSGSAGSNSQLARTSSCHGYAGEWRSKLTVTLQSSGASATDYSFSNSSVCGG
jgi:hypothetical protein